MNDLTAKGMQTRRRVLGDAHVNRAEAGKTEADAPFQALITDAAWGHVWSREAISLRERSMLTIALLAGLGNDHELDMHIRATANTGASPRSGASTIGEPAATICARNASPRSGSSSPAK